MCGTHFIPSAMRFRLHSPARPYYFRNIDMQAAAQINYPQISNPYLPLQGNMNALFGGGASSQFSRGAGSDGGRNPSGQMSNMLSGFSKASFSVFSQTTGNGQSSTFYAQGTISNR